MRDRLASRCRTLSVLAGLLVPVLMAPPAGAGLDTWTSHGPTTGDSLGGGDFAVAVDPVTPTTIYAGTFRNGVFKTTDGGASWAATGLVSGSIATLAIDASAPATVYAGTFGAVYKTTDGGATWVAKTSGLPTASAALVRALAIHPSTPTTVYAGTDPGGVFRSTDAGETWTALTSDPSQSARALVVDPTTPTTLYVALHPRLAPGGAVYKSTDGGQTWTPTGLADGGVLALVIDPLTPSRLYAGTTGKVFRSTDVERRGQRSTRVSRMRRFLRSRSTRVRPSRCTRGSAAPGSSRRRTAAGSGARSTSA